jgi:hypothetical protein
VRKKPLIQKSGTIPGFWLANLGVIARQPSVSGQKNRPFNF